ncbi:MAG TPA: hypothetical protein VM452_01170 [Caulifigura sp.]|nr:hypothetical protein [Caulifigura sp.]
MSERAKVGLLGVALMVLVAGVGSLQAAKPAPPQPPPPPLPPPSVTYVWDEAKGGWYDAGRKLVWGYAPPTYTGSLTSFPYATNQAANYAQVLLQESANLLVDGDYYMQLSIDWYADGDALRGAYYYNRAVQAWADSPLFADAAEIAAQHGNWRLPTKDEAVDAVAKGLFTYGPNGFDSYDCSPAAGLQPLGSSRLNWTSTTGKKNGIQCAWAFAADGGLILAGQSGSAIEYLVVRSVP